MALTDTGSARMSLIREVGTPPATPATPGWLSLPFTSESLSEKLTSGNSAVMREDRQFASSRILRAESQGDVGLEMAKGLWFDEICQGIIQAVAVFPASPASLASDDIVNGKTKTFFSFEKRLEAESGDQYMRFQGCQLSTLAIDVQSNALVGMTLGVIGLNSSNDTNILGGATYVPFDIDDQMDANYASLEFKDSGDTPIDVTANSFTLNLDNQMRGQQAVGSLYNAGNASGRFKATISTNVYFRNQDLYNKFIANEGIKVFITLNDSAGSYYKFSMENVKVTSYDVSAGGADQDIILPIEFQAYPAASAGDKTLTITRYTA